MPLAPKRFHQHRRVAMYFCELAWSMLGCNGLAKGDVHMYTPPKKERLLCKKKEDVAIGGIHNNYRSSKTDAMNPI